MSDAAFYNELRNGSESLWQTIFDHPFVKGIGEGSLSYDRYEFFLKQDYIYLIDFNNLRNIICRNQNKFLEFLKLQKHLS